MAVGCDIKRVKHVKHVTRCNDKKGFRESFFWYQEKQKYIRNIDSVRTSVAVGGLLVVYIFLWRTSVMAGLFVGRLFELLGMSYVSKHTWDWVKVLSLTHEDDDPSNHSL